MKRISIVTPVTTIFWNIDEESLEEVFRLITNKQDLNLKFDNNQRFIPYHSIDNVMVEDA
jgi:hypothetical protein